MCQLPQCPYSYFSQTLEFHLGVFFLCEYKELTTRGESDYSLLFSVRGVAIASNSMK